jgi:hypothetical protein
VLYVHIQRFNEIACDESDAILHLVNDLEYAALQAVRGVSQRVELRFILLVLLLLLGQRVQVAVFFSLVIGFGI